MRVFCFCAQPLLLPTLGQSLLIVPLYLKWKPMMMLGMVTFIFISRHGIHFFVVQDGGIRFDLGYMSSNTGSRFSLRHPNPRYHWESWLVGITIISYHFYDLLICIMPFCIHYLFYNVLTIVSYCSFSFIL
jgi:hypothetical protein